MSEREPGILLWLRFVGRVLGLTAMLFLGAAGVGLGLSYFLGGRSFFELILATTTPAIGGIGFGLTGLLVPDVVNRGAVNRAVGWTAPLLYLGWMGFGYCMLIGNPSGPMTALIYDPALVWRHFYAWVGVLLVGWGMMALEALGRAKADAGLVE